jgi:hypothetical protein
VVFIKTALGQIIMHLCFYIRCDLWVTYYILVHPVRETSMALFFMLMWAQYRFDKLY